MRHGAQWLDRTLTIATILAGVLAGSCTDKTVIAPDPLAQFSMGGGDDGKDGRRDDDDKDRDDRDRDKDRDKDSDDRNDDRDKCDDRDKDRDRSRDNDKGKCDDHDDDDDDNGHGNGNESSVTVSPVIVILKPGEKQQLNVTTKGKCSKEGAVTFTSSKPSVAMVSSTGLVTGVSAGITTISAKCRNDKDYVIVTVLPSKPGSGGSHQSSNADPSELPAAQGQTPPPGTYGRTLSSGQAYRDPLTNVTVLKVTDASTPRANLLGTDKGYSEGGPMISQPWTGSDGQTYYTFTVTVEGEQWLVDVRYATLTLTNWRRVTYASEIGFAFSLNPATPRIAVGSSRVDLQACKLEYSIVSPK